MSIGQSASTRASDGGWTPTSAPATTSGGAVHAAALAVLDPLRQGHHTAEPGSVQRLDLVVDDIDAARDDLISRGVDVSEVDEQRPPGFEARPGALVLRVRLVQRPGRQRLAAPRGHDPAARPGMGGLTWTSPSWQICCMRRPSATAPSRRPLHRTTGGTGTRPTWTPASGGAHRRRPPQPPTATWRRSSRLWRRTHEDREPFQQRPRVGRVVPVLDASQRRPSQPRLLPGDVRPPLRSTRSRRRPLRSSPSSSA